MTPLQKLHHQLQRLIKSGGDQQAPPAAVLWPDPDRVWINLVPLLAAQWPEFYTLGDYAPGQKQGPAIWLRSIEARLIEPPLRLDLVPIFYLPGYGLTDLSPEVDAPAFLRPLCELIWRGCIFKGKKEEWNPASFLRTECKLELSKSHEAEKALNRCLGKIFSTPIEELSGRSLDALALDSLMLGDPVRALLDCLEKKDGEYLKSLDPSEREACLADWKRSADFDLLRDGLQHGVELLLSCPKHPRWSLVWQRFQDNPDRFPGLRAKMLSVIPKDMMEDMSRYPGQNRSQEDTLKITLKNLAGKEATEIRRDLPKLALAHSPRRDSIWTTLGESPALEFLGVLSRLAAATAKIPDGQDAEALREVYTREGYLADAAAIDLLQLQQKAELQEDWAELAAKFQQKLYVPWLSASADRLQRLMRDGKGRGLGKGPQLPDEQPGDCIFFIDGLRYDQAQELMELLKDLPCEAKLSDTWSVLPSVTASGKPAVSPIRKLLKGGDPASFTPHLPDGKPLTQDRLKSALASLGCQFLATSETGDPQGKAWTECGDLDHYGHEHGLRLARHIPVILEDIVERIRQLLAAGWPCLRLVTDHGWQLVPGGLPKFELPTYLTESKWGRCAYLKPGTQSDLQQTPWHWEVAEVMAMPPGISSHKSGAFYTHGGISLQECVTPIIELRSTQKSRGPVASASINAATWSGLRLKVKIQFQGEGLRFDLRTRPADTSSSVADGGKELPANGEGSLVVDDSHEGSTATLVICDSSGQVIARKPLTIGDH